MVGFGGVSGVLRGTLATSVAVAALVLAGWTGVVWGDGGDPSAVPEPQVFAPGVVSVDERNVYRGAFSPDGAEFYFFRKVTAGQEDYRIFVTHRSAAGDWGRPERVDLGGEHSDLYPTISPDGERMVFSSYRPTPTGGPNQANLWYVDREGDGWGEPVYMADASDPERYNPGPLFGPDGVLYYKSETWGPDGRRWHLRTRWTGGGFGPPEHDPTLDPFEDWRDDVRLWEGTLSPDGRILVVVVSELDPDTRRTRPGDLWVAVREGDGWSELRPAGDGVNSPGWENFVVFTPDGEQLLFVRDFAAYYTVPVADVLGD